MFDDKRRFSITIFLFFSISITPLPVIADLQFVEAVRDDVGGVDGLAGPRSVAITLDGSYLYAAGQAENAVSVFSRNITTGELTFVQVLKDGINGVDGLYSVNSVTVSIDGRNLYAAGEGEHALAVFSRNSVTGELIFIEVVRDGVNGIDGLRGAKSVTVSPDGNFVYAASYLDNAITVFSRNSTTGGLTFLEQMKDDVGGVDGLRYARSVIVTPDGNHLYAAGYLDEAIVVFSRNSVTGKLTFVEVVENFINGVEGLDGIYSVTVSSDGSHLYAAGHSQESVAVFSRNITTGELTFVEVLRNGVDDVGGLDGCSSVTVSSDGSYVYTAGQD